MNTQTTITINKIPKLTILHIDDDIDKLFTGKMSSPPIREFFIWLSQKRFFRGAINDFIVIGTIFEQNDIQAFQSKYDLEQFVFKNINANYVDINRLIEITGKFLFEHEPIYLMPHSKQEKYMNFVPSFHHAFHNENGHYSFDLKNIKHIGSDKVLDAFRTALDLYINSRSHEIGRIISKAEEKFSLFYTDLFLIEMLLRESKTECFIKDLFHGDLIDGKEFVYDISGLSFREKTLLVVAAMANIRKTKKSKHWSFFDSFGLVESPLKEFVETTTVDMLSPQRSYKLTMIHRNTGKVRLIAKKNGTKIRGSFYLNNQKQQYYDLILTIDYKNGDKETIKSQYGSYLSLRFYLDKKISQ